MSKLQNYFKEASLESFNDAEVTEEQMALQAQAIEMAAKEVEEVSEDTEELEEIEEGLESIATSMEVVLEKGALNPVAAQFAQHAVEGYVGRLGLTADTIVPSLESFGSDTDAEKATVASLEGIKDTIAKVWAAIKAAVSKVFKAIGDFFAKLFGGTDALVKKNKELLEGIETAIKEKYVTEKNAKVTVGAPNSIMYLGKVDSKAVLQGLGNLVSLTVDTRGAIVGEYAKSVKDYGSNIKALQKADEALVDTVLDKMSKTGRVAETVIAKTKSLVLPGDKIVSITVDEGNPINVAQLESHPKAKAFKGDADVSVFELKDLKTIVTDTTGVIESIADSKDDIKKLSEAYDDAVKAADEVYATANKDETVAKFVNGVKARKLLKGMRKPVTKFIAKFDGYSFGVVRSLQVLVKDNLGEYSEKS